MLDRISMMAVAEGAYCTWRKTKPQVDFCLLAKHTDICKDAEKVVKDSQDRLCSQRRAPLPAFVYAQQLQSGRPGGTAVSPGASAGLFGIAACSDHNRTTQSIDFPVKNNQGRVQNFPLGTT